MKLCRNCSEKIPKSKSIKAEFCEQRCSKAWHKRQYYSRNTKKLCEKERIRRSRKYSNSPEGRMMKNAKNRSSLKGLLFDITREDIIIPEICPVLGIKITSGVKSVHDNSPTLDRIVPKFGYVKGNVRVISHRANRLKADASVAEIEKILEDLKRIEKCQKIS